MKRFGLLKYFSFDMCVHDLVYFILGADLAAQQVVNSISLCLNVIIPSLFSSWCFLLLLFQAEFTVSYCILSISSPRKFFVVTEKMYVYSF